jgi:hypothetical protein
LGDIGQANEKLLVNHIQRLGTAGFATDKQTLVQLAYQLAQKLGVSNNFSHQQEMASYTWFPSFLAQNPEISIRQAENCHCREHKQ